MGSIQAKKLENDWEHVACDLCGSSRLENFLTVSDHEFAGDPPYTLVRCADCALVFINPRPGPAIIGRYYGSDYYAHTGVDNTPPSLTRRIRQRLLDGMGGYDRTLAGRLIHACVPRGAVRHRHLERPPGARWMSVAEPASGSIGTVKEVSTRAASEVSGSAVERARAGVSTSEARHVARRPLSTRSST